MKTTTQPNEEPHSPAPCAEVGTGQAPLQAARSAGETRKETRMSEDDSGLGLKVHEDACRELEQERDEWKAKFIQQNKDLGCEMMDPAGTIWDYASATQRENVQLKREVERERALANEAIATWEKTREERDAALIGYNECEATIEDARRALGATAHEGPLLAAMRVTYQRDRLAEALWSMLNQDDGSAIRAGILLRSLGLQSPTNPNEL